MANITEQEKKKIYDLNAKNKIEEAIETGMGLFPDYTAEFSFFAYRLEAVRYGWIAGEIDKEQRFSLTFFLVNEIAVFVKGI